MSKIEGAVLSVNGKPIEGVASFSYTLNEPVTETRVKPEEWSYSASLVMDRDEWESMMFMLRGPLRARTQYWQRRLAWSTRRYRRWLAREFGISYQQARDYCRHGWSARQ